MARRARLELAILRFNSCGADPTVVVVFRTQDRERLVELLLYALTGIPDQVRPEPQNTAGRSLQKHSEELWLKHMEAVEYLGISKSTLY
jgi:hypothetical protein